ncbi:ThuA domain-containing protein [Planctopirus hydrillae]|uniref:ThuA-like domain-containing protein n=1 Tax=Planctopirus hydrillae TaxID=1841610 RepID=A0A1C3EH14_9PLAN|nr:ThuA domain-containing protein [Planctopirus hydrillae]ODA32545.1 hypothetical protein A6X21_19450 [Planctopirus hydrillae]
MHGIIEGLTMIRKLIWPAALYLLSFCGLFALNEVADAGSMNLTLRSRTPVAVKEPTGRDDRLPSTGNHYLTNQQALWDPQKTALIICDMWDQHTCPNAARRVAELAPRVNQVAQKLRSQGVLIIHAPSDTMKFYEEHPARRLAQTAPVAKPETPLQRWAGLDSSKEPPLPIDDSDGGCGGESNWKKGMPYPWTRQIASIEIAEGDAISDSAEIYNLLKARGIENVLVTGVHTNMCVLGRPFAIRQLVNQKFHVALIRDLTDTMYNPAKAPFVSHFTGTDLVVEHIEKYWCPTITSDQLVGGQPFRFQDDQRPHIVMLIGEPEYQTATTLPAFAISHLGKDFRVTILHIDEKSQNHFPGIDAVLEADVLLLSVRRHPLIPGDLQIIRNYLSAGKPVVGIRTASHAFSLRNKPAPEGTIDWPLLDPEVFGGHYTNHYGAELKTTATIVAEQAQHRILKGLPMNSFRTGGSLYQVLPLEEKSTILVWGRAETIEQPQPVAWLFQRADGGTSFYTSLGHIDDFRGSEFPKLLTQAIQSLLPKKS